MELVSDLDRSRHLGGCVAARVDVVAQTFEDDRMIKNGLSAGSSVNSKAGPVHTSP